MESRVESPLPTAHETMSKYRFRLQTLLRLRETHRDENRGRLAEAYRAETILNEQQQEVQRELIGLQQLQRESTTTPQTNVNRLIDVQRHQLALRAQLEAMQKQAEVLTAEIERRRQALVESDQQVRVLEKLRQRQRQKHLSEILLREVKDYDDIGLMPRDTLSSPKRWNSPDRQANGKVET